MLLTEISKFSNDYDLIISNRLFGEKTYLFLQVSFAVFATSICGTKKWPVSLLGLSSGAMLPCWLLAMGLFH